MPKPRNGSKGDSKPCSLDWDSGVLPGFYSCSTAPHNMNCSKHSQILLATMNRSVSARTTMTLNQREKTSKLYRCHINVPVGEPCR